MGKVMFSVCPHLGGYPYPIMLCNISQNSMGQPPGGYPYPIMLCNISQNAMGQPLGGYPARSSWGGTLPGPARGYPGQVPPRARSDGGVPDLGTPPPGYPPPGYPLPENPPARVPPTRVPPQRGRGVPRSGQHREYLLHGGRYASCVHAGGLSCLLKMFAQIRSSLELVFF